MPESRFFVRVRRKNVSLGFGMIYNRYIYAWFLKTCHLDLPIIFPSFFLIIYKAK